MSDDESESNDGLLKIMPTGRLQDVLNRLNRPERQTSVVNLDACLTTATISVPVLQTLLAKCTNIKTLSMRFNNLGSPEILEVLIDWIHNNDKLEAFYFMSSGVDDKYRVKLEDAWKKHLNSHRTDNLGFTLIRVYVDPNAPPPEEE